MRHGVYCKYRDRQSNKQKAANMKKSVVAIVAVAAVAVLGGCATKVDDTPNTVDDGAVVVQPTTPSEPEEKQEPANHKTGDTVNVEGWDLQITEVVLNANAAIAGANQFNEAPEGQYVTVTVTGTNNSADEFNDLAWLSAGFLGSDKVVYDETFVVTPFDDLGEPSEAAPGGTVTYQFVFDVPASALGSGASVLLGYDKETFIVVP